MKLEKNHEIEQPEDKTIIRRNRITIVALIILFVLPILIAIWSFNNTGTIGFKTKNRGDLIQPARPLQPVVLENVSDHSKFELETLKSNWTMLYFVSGTCDDNCFSDLVKIRQSRLAQGGELKRINRVIVLLDMQDNSVLALLNKEHKGSFIVTGKATELKNLTKQFEIDGAKPVREAHRIYLIDPLGNLMLKYEPEHTAGEIVKDLKRLLYVSQVG